MLAAQQRGAAGDGDGDALMTGATPSSPLRTAKRQDASSPAHGASPTAAPHEFKRPNLQVSPASRSMHAHRGAPQSSLAAAAAAQRAGAAAAAIAAAAAEPAVASAAKRRWSKTEDEKLCAAVKAVGLGDWRAISDVHMAGHDLSDAQCMHRWQKVLRPGLVKGAFCEKEDKVLVDCLREGGLKRRWTKQEDEKLCIAVKAVGPHDWKQIAEVHLAGHGRSDMQCLHRWQKVLRAGLVKGAFTEDEDRIIIDCMRAGGLTWMQIAERIPGRIGKQCRERWTNHLDPNLKKGGWTVDEDTILAEAQLRWGNAWTKIAKLLPGRAENAVKNRWNSAFRRKKSAMFGIAEKSEDALRDTATIACARAAMERIDRDEKEPDAGFKQRAPKRAAPGAALEKPDDTAAAPAGAEEPAAASAAPAPAPVMRESPRASPEASPRRAAYGASPAGASPAPRLGTAPPSPSEALDLFGSFGKDTHGDYNDSFLSLDAGDDDDDEGRGSASRLDVDLDVAFETMEVAHRGILGAVDLTGHTPRSLDDKFDLGSPSPYGAASYHASPRRDAPKGDRGGFPRASPDRFGDGARPFGRSFDAPRFHDGSETSTSHHGGDDLFHGAPYHGRTGLTPCGPMLKTPAGMLHGLSPLHNTRSGSRTPLFSVREATDALESMESHRGRGAVYIAAASCGLVFGGVDVCCDLAIELPSDPPQRRQGTVAQDRAAQAEFISPNGQDYTSGGWGPAAPKVEIPSTVATLLASKKLFAARAEDADAAPEAAAQA